MPQNFLSADVDQSFLLPPDVRDWLPEDDLAWLVMDAVGELDLSELYGAYRADGHGRAAFDPAMMVRVLLYAYACGVSSSRQMARRCVRDVAFRVLAGNLAPDHSTISRFRARHQDALAGLFAQVIGLCARAGLVDLGLLAIDGTKIAANASWSANKTEAALGHLVEEAEAAYAARAAALLDEHAATDAAEDTLFGPDVRGDELPAGLRRSVERKARLKAAKQRLTSERTQAQAAQDAKIAAWEKRNATPGARAGRRPNPTPPGPASGKPPRANTTDPDSRAMRGQHTLVQGYNAQAVVTGGQIIVGAGAVNEATDRTLLRPVLTVTAGQLRAAGLLPALPDPEPHSSDPALASTDQHAAVLGGFQTVLADAGYGSEADFAAAEAAGFHLLAPLHADADRVGTATKARTVRRVREPDPLKHPATYRAQQKLATRQGRFEYAQRGRTVEPVFGQIKTVQGFRRFSRRGLAAANAEWLLVCTAHNLRKLHRGR